MKIYTSYFAKIPKLPKDIIPISICGKAPDWYSGLQYKILSPKYGFFVRWKQNHDNDYYTDCFTEQILNHITIESVLSDIQKLSGCKDVALICYEKPTDFCHRHLVAEWLRKNGVECEEYEEDKSK